jgi:uncharacterized protein YutE (UPF0331/DUF86 family)
MVDADLVLKKLAFIETCVEDLRRLARPALIETDLREERFVVHTLQLAIQAALDAASHVVSARRLGEPQSNRELFDALVRAGWLPGAQAPALRNLAGFRNIVVHGYERVDLRIVRDVLDHRLGDLLAFVDALRAALARDADTR